VRPPAVAATAKRPGLWSRFVALVVDSDIVRAAKVGRDTLNLATRTHEQTQAQFRSDMERNIRARMVERVGEQDAPPLVAQLMQAFDAATATPETD
jgi:hypothetical protein